MSDDGHRGGDRLERLRRSPVLDGLDDGAVRSLADAASLRSLGTSEVLWCTGERPEAVALVLSGRLHVERTTEEGERMILRVLGPDELVGLSTLRDQPHTADVVAGEETEVLILSAATLRKLLASNPEIALAALGHLGGLLGRLTDEVAELRFASLEQRLLAKIMRLADGRREIRFTHEELAAQVGATRANVSRALKELERRGVLRLGRGRIEVLAAGTR